MGPIRYIFPAFVLAMWVAWGYGAWAGRLEDLHWVMLGLSYLGCAIIFVNFVYVFSYGYAISMVLANGAVMAMRPGLAGWLIGGLGVAYGLRLGWFVYARYQSRGYAGTRSKGERSNTAVPLPFRIFMWISCSWLMAFVALPAWLAAGSGLTVGVLAGGLLAAIGLVLETVADQQKQSAKAGSPDRFVQTGLFARMRHPNYLGEILFQAGLMITATAAASGTWALLMGLLGPLYIAVLMYYAAQDQDAQQTTRYGNDPAYRDYRARSGSLLPG